MAQRTTYSSWHLPYSHERTAQGSVISWILLAKYNLKILILTCGASGSYVFTPGNVSFVATPKVVVADTVGAGDSFTAMFVSSILKGKTVWKAHDTFIKMPWRYVSNNYTFAT